MNGDKPSWNVFNARYNINEDTSTGHNNAISCAFREIFYNGLEYGAVNYYLFEAIMNGVYGLFIAHDGSPFSSEKSIENGLRFNRSGSVDRGVQGGGMKASCVVLPQPGDGVFSYEMHLASRMNDGSIKAKCLKFKEPQTVSGHQPYRISDSSVLLEDEINAIFKNEKQMNVFVFYPLSELKTTARTRYVNMEFPDALSNVLDNAGIENSNIKMNVGKWEVGGKTITKYVTKDYPIKKWPKQAGKWMTLISKKEQMERTIPLINRWDFDETISVTEKINGVDVTEKFNVGFEIIMGARFSKEKKKQGYSPKPDARFYVWKNDEKNEIIHQRKYPVTNRARVCYGETDTEILPSMQRLFDSPMNINKEVYDRFQSLIGMGVEANLRAGQTAAIKDKKTISDVWEYVFGDMFPTELKRVVSCLPLLDIRMTITPLEGVDGSRIFPLVNMDVLFLKNNKEVIKFIKLALKQALDVKNENLVDFIKVYSMLFQPISDEYYPMPLYEKDSGAKPIKLIPYVTVNNGEVPLRKTSLNAKKTSLSGVVFKNEKQQVYTGRIVKNSWPKGFRVYPTDEEYKYDVICDVNTASQNRLLYFRDDDNHLYKVPNIKIEVNKRSPKRQVGTHSNKFPTENKTTTTPNENAVKANHPYRSFDPRVIGVWRNECFYLNMNNPIVNNLFRYTDTGNTTIGKELEKAYRELGSSHLSAASVYNERYENMGHNKMFYSNMEDYTIPGDVEPYELFINEVILFPVLERYKIHIWNKRTLI